MVRCQMLTDVVHDNKRNMGTFIIRKVSPGYRLRAGEIDTMHLVEEEAQRDVGGIHMML